MKRSSLLLLFVTLLMVGYTFALQTHGNLPGLQPTRAGAQTVSPSLLTDVPGISNDVSVHYRDMKADFTKDVDGALNTNRYAIAAQLTLESDAVIRGTQRVRYTNRTNVPLDRVVFRLYPNTLPMFTVGQMSVANVSVNGVRVKSRLSGGDTVLTVPLSKSLKPSEAVEIALDFSLLIKRGMSSYDFERLGYANDVVSGGSWYPVLSVYDVGRGWWTEPIASSEGDPTYTQTGLYDVRLTVPNEMALAASGTVIDQKANSDGTITYRIVTGPMRDCGFMASKRYTVTTTQVDGTQLNIWHYKDRANTPEDGTQDAVETAKAVLPLFNRLFGQYPYRELDIVQHPTLSGLEFPGLVTISEGSWSHGDETLAETIVHEVGHQWFYGLVGNNQVEYPWLDEALATYTQVVYTRETDSTGKSGEAIARLHSRLRSLFTEAIQQGDIPDLPLNLPVADYPNKYYGLLVYERGQLFYLELEEMLGHEVLYKALRQYVDRFKYGVATSKDLKVAIEEVSGKNLSDLFKKWVGDYDQDTKPASDLFRER
jgi:hypothetical protein